jgi:hypothetical protein
VCTDMEYFGIELDASKKWNSFESN